MKTTRALLVVIVALLSCQSLHATDEHFNWHASAAAHSNYIWRGLYVGGLSLQADAEVSYYGAFINMWWNVGATDYNNFFGTNKSLPQPRLNPEVDMTVGWSGYGLTVMFMHMYYFDKYLDGTGSRYFDFGNHGPGEGGVTTEWRVKYVGQHNYPFSILWCTRTFGRDGYYDDAGNLKRAYSTYIELGYDWTLPYEINLGARVGFTPWKSMYTGFTKDFAVVNLQLNLNRSWQVAEHAAVNVGGTFMLNPESKMPLWNITFGVTAF